MPAPPYGAVQGHEPMGSVDPSGDAVHTFTQHRTEDLLTAVVHARKEYAQALNSSVRCPPPAC